MAKSSLTVLYGHLEGTDGKFARDPSGYLSIDAGIYEKHGLEVSWHHLQGTEARHEALESGEAQLSLVVGRASMRHFLDSGGTRVIGCVMNGCSYHLIAKKEIAALADLRGKSLACREGPARGVPFDKILRQHARLDSKRDLSLTFRESDQEVYRQLINGRIDAALLPRPYGYLAEEESFHRLSDWPEAVDDPLPITIETTVKLLAERQEQFATFLTAHREGLAYMKSHRGDMIELLETKFGHSEALAAKTFDDYFTCIDASLQIDFKQLERLLAQVEPHAPGGARRVAADWVVAGALKNQPW